MLSFQQVNLHRAAQAALLLGRNMEERRQMIVLVTEPYTVNGKITSMPKGTRCIYARPKGQDTRPRAGIVTTMDVSVTAMDSWCTRDCAVALARIGGKQTVLVSLYLDITLEVQPQWLDNLMQMIEAKNLPVIMGIDTNAHSTLYGVDTNARGTAFEDFVLQYGLNVENFGNTPTFETQRGSKHIKTFIDVTLTRDLPTSVKNWRVNTDYNLSLIHI